MISCFRNLPLALEPFAVKGGFVYAMSAYKIDRSRLVTAFPFPSTVPSPGTLEELLLTFVAHWNVTGNSPLSQAESVRPREAELLLVSRGINNNSGTQAGYLGPEAGLASVSHLLHSAFLGPKSHSQTQC